MRRRTISNTKAGKRRSSSGQGRSNRALAKPATRNASARRKATGRQLSPRPPSAKRLRSRKSDNVCSATVTIVERFAGGRDSATKSLQIPLWSMTMSADAGPRKPVGVNRRRGASVRPTSRVCAAFAALGNSARMVILQLLLDGPATYRALQKATGLAAGPLYHHVNQLRLAGLILPKQRDLYELTRGGRNLYMIALTLAPLTGDRRRRRSTT